MQSTLKEKRHGAAAIELAVLLPLLVFTFIIVLDYARVFYYSLTLWNCARQGAIHASDPLQSPFASVQAAALADAADLTPKPAVSYNNGVDEAGNPYVRVSVAWQFSTITNYPGVNNPVQLSQSVQMRLTPTMPN
jgi:Flp pilus assembly protein TadG